MIGGINLTAAEEKLADIIWRETPLTSPELVSLAEKEMDWKKSTTYTVLKKLCGKGICENNQTHVQVVLTRDEWMGHQSRSFVEDIFGGSLPQFITSFFNGKKLSPEQAAELKRLIDEFGEGG